MKVIQITRMNHPGRMAQTVHEFYYRGYPVQDNGLRDVAAEMIDSGEIVSRTLALNTEGDQLTAITIFASEDAYQKWENHPTLAEAREMWKGRPWTGGNEIIYCQDYVDVEFWKWPNA